MWYNRINLKNVNQFEGGTGMIERIIIPIMVMGLVVFWIGVFLPLKTMVTTRDSIFWIFENAFDIYPEEIPKSFPPNCLRQMEYGVITLRYYNLQTACTEFETDIDNLLKYYEKHPWIVERFLDRESDEERLREIRERVRWLKKRN